MRDIKPAIIFLLAFFTYVVFGVQEPRNPQQVTRLALAYSLSEGRLDIDRHAKLTIDAAQFDGHAYADKLPGLSILAVPAVFVTRATLAAAGQSTDATELAAYGKYLTAAAMSTVALLAALAAAALYMLARRLGATERGALFASFALALGTPFFGWSTTFFAHAASGGMLLIALALVVWSNDRRAVGCASPALDFAIGVVLGFLLVIDLTVAPGVMLIGLLLLFGGDWRQGWLRRLLALGAGGVIGLLPLPIYNWAAFHSPFRLGYESVVGFDEMKQGMFGISLPSITVLGELLFGLYRGLLPFSPVLLMVPMGLVALWRRGSRGVVLVVVGVVASALLINSSYAYWDGGWSTGPRHLVAMLPVACLGLAFVAPRGVAGRVLLGLLLAVSLVFSVASASVDMFTPFQYAAPLLDYLLPRFFAPAQLLSAAPIVVPWIGFAVLLCLRISGAERHQLAA